MYFRKETDVVAQNLFDDFVSSFDCQKKLL